MRCGIHFSGTTYFKSLVRRVTFCVASQNSVMDYLQTQRLQVIINDTVTIEVIAIFRNAYHKQTISAFSVTLTLSRYFPHGIQSGISDRLKYNWP